MTGPELLGGTDSGISEEIADDGLKASLCLIEPDEITFVCEPPFNPGKEKRARAVFRLNSHWYDLGVTDGVVGPQVRTRSYGSYSPSDLGFGSPGHTVVTASLTTPFKGSRWKLVAAVLFLPDRTS
jgi:hypothetical protein